MHFDSVSMLLGLVLGVLLAIGWVCVNIRSWLAQILDGGVTPVIQELVERMKSDTSWKFQKEWEVGPITLEIFVNHQGYVLHAWVLGYEIPLDRWSP